MRIWSVEKIRAGYESTCYQRKLDTEKNIKDRMGLSEPDEYEAYWESVRVNLELQRLRLVLVADKINVETIRIIEYLNRQMKTTDVFAIAVPQYAGGSVRALAPRVLNPSLVEVDRKRAASSLRGERWTAERFYAELDNRNGPDAVTVFSAIQRWAEGRAGVRMAFGRGTSSGSMQFSCVRNDLDPVRQVSAVFLTLWTSGSAEIEFEYIATKPPFDELNLREELREKLNSTGVALISAEKIDKRPNIPYQALVEKSALHGFLEVQDWLVEHFVNASISLPQETSRSGNADAR
jgi:hypothetical protein